MAKTHLTFYRVWCGRKLHSCWLPSRQAAFLHALRRGLAYGVETDQIGLGPLTWIETGTRKYARSRTIPLPR